MTSTMQIFLFLLSTILVTVNCQVVNPWVDNSSCLPTDTPAACSLKKKQCSPVNNILNPSGTGGMVGSITTCTNASGTTLGPTFYMTVGLAYAHGNPESLMDSLSSDSKISATIRLCVLNSSGLIGSDLKFNRTAAMVTLTKQPLGPNLVVPVFTALLTCPEPVDYIIGPFLSCIRKACMANATATYPSWTGSSGGSAFGAGPYGGSPSSSEISPEVINFLNNLFPAAA